MKTPSPSLSRREKLLLGLLTSTLIFSASFSYGAVSQSKVDSIMKMITDGGAKFSDIPVSGQTKSERTSYYEKVDAGLGDAVEMLATVRNNIRSLMGLSPAYTAEDIVGSILGGVMNGVGGTSGGSTGTTGGSGEPDCDDIFIHFPGAPYINTVHNTATGYQIPFTAHCRNESTIKDYKWTFYMDNAEKAVGALSGAGKSVSVKRVSTSAGTTNLDKILNGSYIGLMADLEVTSTSGVKKTFHYWGSQDTFAKSFVDEPLKKNKTHTCTDKPTKIVAELNPTMDFMRNKVDYPNLSSVGRYWNIDSLTYPNITLLNVSKFQPNIGDSINQAWKAVKFNIPVESPDTILSFKFNNVSAFYEDPATIRGYLSHIGMNGESEEFGNFYLDFSLSPCAGDFTSSDILRSEKNQNVPSNGAGGGKAGAYQFNTYLPTIYGYDTLYINMKVRPLPDTLSTWQSIRESWQKKGLDLEEGPRYSMHF